MFRTTINSTIDAVPKQLFRTRIIALKNKRPKEDRYHYKTKRQKVLESHKHLIKFDLLRGGRPLSISGEVALDGYILVSRSDRPPQ